MFEDASWLVVDITTPVTCVSRLDPVELSWFLRLERALPTALVMLSSKLFRLLASLALIAALRPVVLAGVLETDEDIVVIMDGGINVVPVEMTSKGLMELEAVVGAEDSDVGRTTLAADVLGIVAVDSEIIDCWVGKLIVLVALVELVKLDPPIAPLALVIPGSALLLEEILESASGVAVGITTLPVVLGVALVGEGMQK